ncbi:MAG: hypothetical protein ACMXYF_06000 [Candidatus Woesearchaeota archaeon]
MKIYLGIFFYLIILTACSIENDLTESDFIENTLHRFMVDSEIDESEYVFHFTLELKFPLEAHSTQVENYTGFIPEDIILKEVTENGEILRDIGTLHHVVGDERKFHLEGSTYIEIERFTGTYVIPWSGERTRHVIFIFERNNTLYKSTPYSFDYERLSLHHKRFVRIQEEGPKPNPPSFWRSEETNTFEVFVNAKEIMDVDGQIPLSVSLEEIDKDETLIQKIVNLNLSEGSYRGIIDIPKSDRSIRYFRASLERTTGEIAQSNPTRIYYEVEIIPIITGEEKRAQNRVEDNGELFYPDEIDVCFAQKTPSERIAQILNEQQLKAIPPLSSGSYEIHDQCFWLLLYNQRLETAEDTITLAQKLMDYEEILFALPNYLIQTTVQE